jgi:hypothetical protein
VRVIRAEDPDAAALELAIELDAELITDEESAERAVTARVEAGRTDAIALGPDELAELRTRAALHGPTVDATTLHELRRLADELGRADRIRVRTEVSLTEQLTRRLSNGSSVAIHPASLLEASAAVSAADAELAAAEQALADLGEEPELDRPSGETAVDQPPGTLDDATSTPRRVSVAAIGIMVALVGAAVILLALGVAPVVPLGLIAVGLAAGLVMTWRGRRQHEDTIAVSERSSALAAATAHLTLSEQEVQTSAAQARWLEQRLDVQVMVDRADERARSARRHWESLAGPSADPYDIDGVLRARDPQYELLGAATKASPTVRTANALHRAAAARWKIAWAGLGHPDPPSLDEADLLLARFGDEGDQQAGEAAIARLKAADAWAAACAILDQSLVLVAPSTWLSESRLESLLLTLPAGADVVIVER